MNATQNTQVISAEAVEAGDIIDSHDGYRHLVRATADLGDHLRRPILLVIDVDDGRSYRCKFAPEDDVRIVI